MCTSTVFLAGEEVSNGYRLRLYSILLMLRIPIYLKSWRKKILRSEAHDSVVYGWPRSLPEVRTVFQIHPIPCSRSFSPGPLDKQAPISTHKFSRLTSLNSGCIWLNNCVAECRRVPGMSRGFHFWQRQTDRQTDWQIDRVTGLWLVNRAFQLWVPGQWNQAPVTLIKGGGVGKKPNLMHPRLAALAPLH